MKRAPKKVNAVIVSEVNLPEPEESHLLFLSLSGQLSSVFFRVPLLI